MLTQFATEAAEDRVLIRQEMQEFAQSYERLALWLEKCMANVGMAIRLLTDIFIVS